MFDSNGINRRSFLKKSGAAVVAGSVFPTIIPSSAFGAADRVNLAVIGVHGQGTSHISGFPPLPDVRLHTLADIDGNVLAMRGKAAAEKLGYAPKLVNDMRRVFDDPEVDAVTFAIPNHWHALAAIWAVQAGKHVYVEKPASHSIWEGRQMVNASRKYNKLIQVGFQNRSRLNTTAAIKLIHGGGLGKVKFARGLCHKSRPDIGLYPDGPMQPGEKVMLTVGNPNNDGPYTAEYLANVNYDMWQGPRAVRPFNRNRFHYNWHWQWEYGNGDTGNQGPHQLDVGRWGINQHDFPVKISSKGGLFGSERTAQTTPDTQTSLFEYADGTVFEFSTRGMNTNPEGGVMIGNIFYGTEGRLEMDDGGNWKTFMGRRGEPGPNSADIKEEASDARITVGTGSGGHYANFVNAVRTGKVADLNCDIEEGHRSSVLAHMANISYRLGRELKTDGKAERFLNDAEANAMIRESYRAPYVVPDLG